jgi:hypothetical protein
MSYKEFLKKKEIRPINAGINIERNLLNKYLFDFQRDIVWWALKKGRCAIFADTGLGKTLMQLSWAEQIANYTNGKILILAPLAVADQTIQQGKTFGIDVNSCRSQDDVIQGLNITNYEMLEHFDAGEFSGIVLDESSIIKSFTGKTTQLMIERFRYTPFKLCCTATPAPNDYVELGNHAEFLGIMPRQEMLATFFVHDSGDTAKWRLKGHAEKKFWEWLASWAMVIKSPENLGYNGDLYNLPPLNIMPIVVESPQGYMLVPELANTLNERREARKESIGTRILKAKEIAESVDTCLIWCDFNLESEMLKKAITNSVEVKGSDKPSHKKWAMLGFASGEVKKLISKPSICGFGMNWQQCNNIIFCGLSDSYEQFYQAIRRCWRFGQTKEVNVYVIISERELNVLANNKRKEEIAQRMSDEMVRLTADILKAEIHQTTRITIEYEAIRHIIVPNWLEGASI